MRATRLGINEIRRFRRIVSPRLHGSDPTAPPVRRCSPLPSMRLSAWLLLTLSRLLLSSKADKVVESGHAIHRWTLSSSHAKHSDALSAEEQVCDPFIHHNLLAIRGGGWIIPAGWNPFGYRITSLGQEFLSFDGAYDSDVGRFLASLKDRKRFKTLKAQWLEVLRVSKSGQSMRIYKKLQQLLQFCLKAGLID